MQLIDPMDIAYDPMLSKMQGNILKGHGRDYTAHLFLRFEEGQRAAALTWMGTQLAEACTSFKKQLFDRDRYNRNKVKGGLYTAFFLTAAGYKVLGYEEHLSQFGDEAFREGMKIRGGYLNDPDQSHWEKGYQHDLHAMVLLADDDAARLIRGIRDVFDATAGFANIAVMENGNVLRNENDDGIEHFGYVDGISQPLFLKDELDKYMKYHGTKEGEARFNPAADRNKVLIKDPLVEDADAYGSYFVFRKLEQNVKGFKETEKALGLGELGGAYLVGRFEDGSPVVVTDEEGLVGSGRYNNFNYEDDNPALAASATRCPYFAHIRKTNARKERSMDPLIVRRGIPYGTKGKVRDSDHDDDESPEKGVGLLFMCYQADIASQFEKIQQFANTGTTSNGGASASAKDQSGIDAIIGQPAEGNSKAYQYLFPSRYGKNGLYKEGNFKQFVTLKGGDYFFAPSIVFLKSLNRLTQAAVQSIPAVI